MLPLEAPPKYTEFITLDEYKSSAPVSFALEESPVLYFCGDVHVSGAVSGQVQLWVTTSGIYLWQAPQGQVISLSEIVLHAMDGPKLYIQGEDFELWVKGPATVHAALTECIETQEYHSSSEGEGYSIHDDQVDLQTGEGDDENWDLQPGEDPAAAAVRMGSLGKRRRDDS